ncbi:MAG TPA: TIGR03000 domain-containing protein [Gemmataceae bacterium]|nr:TIGR03000 domain-containing protein [Gemmataceae bacterium]
MKDLVKCFLAPAALLAALALPTGAARAEDQATASITVVVPADADVFFDGQPTIQKGPERLFLSPPLPVGKKLHYDVLARWKEGGQTVEKTKRIEVSGGATVRVDFLTAETKPEPKTAGVAVGKSVGAPGRLIQRVGGPMGVWQPVPDKGPVYAEDTLIGLIGSEVETPDGTTRFRLLKYFNSPLPVLEPAVTIHQSTDYDLDLTLERGFVEIWNNKPQGSACVQIQARGEKWEAILDGKDSRMLVELYSCWPKGEPFKKEPGPKDVPLAQMTFLVLKGQAALKHNGKQLAMSAPPGPALIEWDSATGMDDSPRALETLPDWVLPPKDDKDKEFQKKIDETVGQFAAEIQAKSLDGAIDEFLASDDVLHRRLAVIALAATDQLKRLAAALKETDKPDVWDNAVLALRHWIGRAPGQDQILYQHMIDNKVFTPREADTVMQLLHDFGDDDLARPVTYEMLINLLGSDKLFIRGLAYWHLERMVPEGKAFGYSPFGPDAERQAAIKKWKELIPTGKLPPEPKEPGK